MGNRERTYDRLSLLICIGGCLVIVTGIVLLCTSLAPFRPLDATTGLLVIVAGVVFVEKGDQIGRRKFTAERRIARRS